MVGAREKFEPRRKTASRLVWDLLAGGALDTMSLADRAADLRKHVSGVRSNQPDSPEYNHENHRKHY
jgi:hypothetical protein